MNSFISRVVNDLIAKNAVLSEITFVLPSQRACVYLKDELIRSNSSVSFLPKIFSIENYIQQVADMVLIDNVQLLFEFYSTYKETVKKENEQSFEVFSQWATVALQDFNEIDSYLVNTQAFFSDLRDIKRLNTWFDKKEPSKLAIDYLDFFEQLHYLYERLYERLKKKKVGYQGLIYREVQNNLEYYIQNNSNKKLVFIGFNALNKSEELLFQELLNHEMASVYWDCNSSFMDSEHEAGKFLRNYKNNWVYYKNHPFLWIDNAPDFSDKNVQIIGAPKNTTQIKYAGELLSGIDSYEKTACVLADENVLPLMLGALPDSIKNINITMGYPLKDVPVSQLFKQLFTLHLNQEKFDLVTEKKFYYKDVLSLLNSQILNRNQGILLANLKERVNSENSLFLSVSDLKKHIGKDHLFDFELFLSLFKQIKSVDEIIQRCLDIIDFLKEDISGLEKEYLFRLYKIFQQLLTLNRKYKHIGTLKILNVLFKQLLLNEKLSFQGEPLSGLQLMGMLETRALDFDTLLITSVNEGILPSGKKDNSFIPFDAKKHYGLPTHHEKDAIFSYHFHRLLQRVKKCYLLYNSEMDGYGSGEKSRFLTMLKINYPEISDKIVSPISNPQTAPERRILKTPEVLIRIKEVFSKGISPSALTTYIANPIRFYEQKILGVKSKKEVEETVEMNTMGSVIHEVLESLYTPFVGKFLKKEDIQRMRTQLANELKVSFQNHYVRGSIRKGKNKLIYEVCKKYLLRFLSIEENSLKANDTIKILSLERKLEMEIVPPALNFPVKIHGIVDRIEERNGTVRVIDYKTGAVTSRFLTVTEDERFSESYDYSKALQLMLYGAMYLSDDINKHKPVVAGIISFKSLNSGFLQLKFSRSKSEKNFITPDRVSTFMGVIEDLLIEIYNPDLAFIENSDAPF